VATVGGLASWVADSSSPAVAGIGSSYLAGFFIGWVSRRFLKMAALISGGLLACIAVLEETGWIVLDWTSVEPQIRHAIAAVHRGLKNSNTSSRGISHQRRQQGRMFFGFLKK
jgi:uncharacterized membrane protein (Fun14 family)